MMHQETGEGRRRQARRAFIVDRPVQFSIIFSVWGAMVCTGVLVLAAWFLLPAEEAFETLSGAETREMVLKLTGAFFGLIFSAAGIAIVIISHRVAGPARVIAHALRSFRHGDYLVRTKLRSKDYLQDVAAAAGELGDHLREEELWRSELVNELRELSEQGDLEGVRELVGAYADRFLSQGARMEEDEEVFSVA